MFCPNCGAKNDDAARFCMECGNALGARRPVGAQQPVHPTAQPSKRTGEKVSWRRIIAVIQLLLLAVICFFCYRQTRAANDPGAVVHKYMEAVRDQDWETAYTYLSLPDSPFLTFGEYERVFSRAMMSDVTDYSVQENRETEPDGFSRNYQVQYGKRGSNDRLKTDIRAVKGKEKSWIVLENWEIVPEEWVVGNIHLMAFSDAAVKLDGILLDSAVAEINQDGDYTVYTLPYVFAGSHVLEVFMDGFEPYSQVINISGSQDSVFLELPNAGIGTMKELSDRTCDLWSRVIDGIVNQTDPGWNSEELDYSYESAQREYDMGGQDSFITGISLDHISISLDEYGYRDGMVYARIVAEGTVGITGQYGSYPGYGRPVSYETRAETKKGLLTATYCRDGNQWIVQEFYTDLR